MMNEIALYRFISRSPIGLLSRRKRHRPSRIVLVYHGIDGDNPFCLNARLFREHIRFIKSRYEMISLEETISIENQNNRTMVSITFDDAFVNIIENALPLLLEHKIPAMIYVPTNYLGKKNHWDKGPILDIMTSAHLREISSLDFSIGSHTRNHVRLWGLDQAALKNEIQGSKKDLEDILGIPVRSFAYPHGGRSDFDENACIMVKDSGYTSAATGFFGRENSYSNRFEIKRIGIWPNDTVEDVKLRIEGHYDWLAPKERAIYKLRRILRIPK